MKEFERYDEWYDSILRTHLEKSYKEEYSKGWCISNIVKLDDDKWIIKWKKKLME